MEKDTFLSLVNLKELFRSSIFRRNVIWNIFVLIGLYILFNLFTITEIEYFFEENLDSKIGHEIEHLSNSIKVSGDSLILLHQSELEVSDLTELTENPFFLQIYRLDGTILLQSENFKYIYEMFDWSLSGK